MRTLLLATASAVAMLSAASNSAAQTPPRAEPPPAPLNPAQSPAGGEAETPATRPARSGAGEPLTDVGTALDADVAEVETIVVTGSRVTRAGFEAPTPVTVASTEQLTAASPTTIGDALRQLPSLNASVGPRGAQTSGGQGGAFLALRNLGAIRP
jgi:hypothetical protein